MHPTTTARLLLATISPQLINFQLNLPLRWNAKALQYGGGGFSGVLITGLAPLRDAAPGDALPISRGYATLGTDSGHQAAAYPASEPGAFALNDEMLQNFAYASYKKVRDVAVRVQQTSALIDSTDPDLSAFFARGGKLISARTPATGPRAR